MGPPQKIATSSDAKAFILQYDHFLFDCDGVVWLDTEVIPGVPELVELLRASKKTFAFVTNNSLTSREAYMRKFQKLGFKDISKDLIFPTCYAAGLVLSRKLNVPKGAKIWVLGDEGIEEELRECGYEPVGGTDPRLDAEWDPNHELLEVDPEVKAVVVGSTKKLNYMRIATTIQYVLQEPHIPFIGTNIDRSYPGPKGRILPAGGSVVNFVHYTANRDFLNVGKPSPVILEAILLQRGFDRKKTVMVGDTLYTDIKFGNDGNLGDGKGSLLVLSGGTKLRDLDNVDDSEVPLYYIESLGHLLELLRGD